MAPVHCATRADRMCPAASTSLLYFLHTSRTFTAASRRQHPSSPQHANPEHACLAQSARHPAHALPACHPVLISQPTPLPTSQPSPPPRIRRRARGHGPGKGHEGRDFEGSDPLSPATPSGPLFSQLLSLYAPSSSTQSSLPLAAPVSTHIGGGNRREHPGLVHPAAVREPGKPEGAQRGTTGQMTGGGGVRRASRSP